MIPDRVSRILLDKKILSETTLAELQQSASALKQTLFQYLSQHHLINAEDFAHHCATTFQLPYFSIEKYEHQPELLNCIPLSTLKKYLIFPIKKQNNTLSIAIADPNDIDFCNTLSFHLNISIQIVFSKYDTLQQTHNSVIHTLFYHQFLKKSTNAQTIVETILSDAIYREASDIHLEPYQYSFRIRFRIDGILHEIISLQTALIDTVTSCFKVLANLDIAIKRMPQDGRFSFRTALGFYKDCRINTCPTQHGEKIVIRLLDTNTKINTLATLGLTESEQQIILKTISKPQGLILVTGPTGSGKTITLYTLLNLLNQSSRNISTIEDPIEIQLHGINQIPINTKSGLNFSTVLRALLRQDPDVLMIGEIRDEETADMAIRAAQTGHLVLSTLHTNSAAEAITRLSHMGVSPFHLGSALSLIIAQRLVRRLCLHCKNATDLHCAHCKNGYAGRIGIFELLPIHADIKQMIFDKHPHTNVTEKNRAAGNMRLWESGLRCVHDGLTTMRELFRAIPESE
jgi:type IV pilus assembly protein PilB